jgi:hypothetical protein
MMVTRQAPLFPLLAGYTAKPNPRYVTQRHELFRRGQVLRLGHRLQDAIVASTRPENDVQLGRDVSQHLQQARPGPEPRPP